jgi:outer membrane protein TolC
MTLRQLVDLAVQNNPGVLESRKRWEEKQARVALAKAWPNPEIGFMKDDIPTGTLNPFKGMMTEYTLTQEIMNPGKLKAMGKMASSDAEMARSDYLDKRMNVYVDVKQAYYDLLYTDKALEIMRQNQELMGELIQLAQINYSSGMAPLQNALKAQTEFSKMTAELLNMASMVTMAKAKVNAILGRRADTPLDVREEFSTPPPDFDFSELQQEAETVRPAIKSMEWGVKMANDGVTLAKKQQLPDFKLTLGYKTVKQEGSGESSDGIDDPDDGMDDDEMDESMDGITRAQSTSSMSGGRSSTWKLELMVMLPLWRDKNKAEIKAATAGLEAAQASLAGMKNMTGMDLLMALSEAQSTWRQIGLYESTVLPQAEQTWQAGVIGYASGKVDFMAVMDGLVALRNTQLDYYKTRVNYEKAAASLEKAVGKPLFAGK